MPRFGIGTSEYGQDYRLGYGLTVFEVEVVRPLAPPAAPTAPGPPSTGRPFCSRLSLAPGGCYWAGGTVRKGAVTQPSGPGRDFKGLGVAKRYCRKDPIGDIFTQYWIPGLVQHRDPLKRRIRDMYYAREECPSSRQSCHC